MSHRYRIPNRSKMASGRVRTAMKRLRAILLDQTTGTLHDAVQGVFNIASKILPGIGKPIFDPRYLVEDADPEPWAWNANLESIEDDLRLLFDEIQEIRQLRAEVTNAAAITSGEIEEKANLAQSILTDLRLTGGQLDQEVIVASDNFLDDSKIDGSFPLQFPDAELNTMQGAVTLKRTQALNVINENTEVQITPIGPQELVSKADQGRLPTPDGTMRFYEGRFFAPLGQARPEGGRWHLEEKVKPGVTVPGDSTIYTMDDNSGTGIFDEFPDLRREADERPQGFPLSPEDIIVIDRGAPLAELKAGRRKMVDNSPDSFWEGEFVVDATALDQLIEEREAEEASVTPQELRARAARNDIDRFDFEVEMVIKLDRRQLVNFIVINPMNFEETAWLEVTEVSTAESDEDAFVPVDGFDSQLFENVLTDDANAELTDGQTSTVLAPSKYSYRGQGVYSFAPREVSRIRVRLKQRTPTPSEYERIVIQLTRTLTATTSKFKGSCFPGYAHVMTPTGVKAIKDLRVGDVVSSYEPKTRMITRRKITRVLEHKPEQVYRIRAGSLYLDVTANHTLLTAAGWKTVSHLQPDDRLLHLSHGRELEAGISWISPLNTQPVYNIFTEHEHNFIVDGFVAHNFTFLRRLRTWFHRQFKDSNGLGTL